jgi:hypothetical protein
MKRRHSTIVAILALALAASLFAQSGSKGSVTSIHHANGAFDIKMTPMPADDYADGKALGRVAADKLYHGDLEGSGKGQMLTATGEVKGSAVYVATERVVGILGGRSGTFLLAHRGVMTRGAQQLEIDVVPDSGTGELQGIAGKLSINVTPDGKHVYDFEYTLPSK